MPILPTRPAPRPCCSPPRMVPGAPCATSLHSSFASTHRAREIKSGDGGFAGRKPDAQKNRGDADGVEEMHLLAEENQGEHGAEGRDQMLGEAGIGGADHVDTAIPA